MRPASVALALFAAAVAATVGAIVLLDDGPASGHGAAVPAPPRDDGPSPIALPVLERDPPTVAPTAPEALAPPPAGPVAPRAVGTARVLDPWSVSPVVLPLGGDLPAELTITGRVVGLDGLGLEGAEVTLLRGGRSPVGNDDGSPPRPHRREGRAGGAPLLRDLASAPRAFTVRDGTFALRATWDRRAVDAGVWTTARPPQVLVRFPGRASATRGVGAHRVRDGTADLGEIMLDEEATLSGRVLDEDGRPVADALVAAEDLLPEHSGFVWSGLSVRVEGVHAARTDDAGWYVLDELYCGHLDVSATAPGYDRVVRRLVELPCDGRPRDLDPLVLPGGRVVQGRVVDERGAPLPGALVFATAGGAGAVDAWFSLAADDRAAAWGLHIAAEDATRRADTDGDGRFRFSGPPDRELLLIARADGREPTRVVVSPDERGARLVLRPQALWRVRVVTGAADETSGGASGSAVPAARVFALRLGLRTQEHLPLEVSRDGDAFVVHGAGPHGTLLDVSAPGRARTFVETPAIGPGARGELVVPLPPGARLLGRVVDEEGRPLPDQPVRVAEGWGSFGRTGLAEGRTDADGRFVADGLRAGWHWIEAGEKPWPTVRQRVEVFEGVDQEVVVTIQDLFGARGK